MSRNSRATGDGTNDDVMAHVDGPAQIDQQATAAAVLPTATRRQHTPGPWVEARHGAERYVVGNDTFSSVVCQIRVYLADEISESFANARLIAAAPDLLAALDECRVIFRAITDLSVGSDAESDRQCDRIASVLTQIDAAIAKAEAQ